MEIRCQKCGARARARRPRSRALDILDATTFWYLYRAVPPARILQSIAAGVPGKDAFIGGHATAALGTALHVAIACGIATDYLLACRAWPWLLRRPLIAGIGRGVVAPLSRARLLSFTLPWLLANAFGHILLVGLPLAWVACVSARR